LSPISPARTDALGARRVDVVSTVHGYGIRLVCGDPGGSGEERVLLVLLVTDTPVARMISAMGPPWAAHAAWWLFDRDGGFATRCVDLEEPTVRWDGGALAGINVAGEDSGIWHGRTARVSGRARDELEFLDHDRAPDPDAVRAEDRGVIPVTESGTVPSVGAWCDFGPDTSRAPDTSWVPSRVVPLRVMPPRVIPRRIEPTEWERVRAVAA
jgi:hypothetical protein